jgi:hypothetical protein
MASLLFVIGVPNVTRRPWRIGGVEFAVNRHALSEQPSYLSSRFMEIICLPVQMQV